jgi:hypothetical protein
VTFQASQPTTRRNRSPRAAERHRQGEHGQAGIDHIEQGRAADGEQIGQPTLSPIVDDQSRLFPGDARPRRREGGGRDPQLVRRRPVLGVIDRQ